LALPQSIHSNNFDNFFTGYENAPNISNNKFIEEIIERVRFFAEECDYLASISIMTDVDDGFGGLTTSLVPSLREEFGSSVIIPIFGLSNGLSSKNPTDNLTRAENLRNIQLAIIYGSLFGHSDVFCPIAMESTIDRNVMKLSSTEAMIWSSSNIAAVMNVLRSPMAFSSSISSAQMLGHRQWLDDVTLRRQYPLLSIEALYPEAIDLSDTNLKLWPYLQEEKSLVSSLSLSDSAEHRMVSLSSKVMNPFLKSLSIFRRHLSRADDRAKSVLVPYSQRAPVNSVFVRGPCREDLSTRLFLKCLNTDYAVTSFHQRNAPLCIPAQYPYINETGAVGYLEESINAEDFLSPTMAALGVDAHVGFHLEEQVDQWSEMLAHPSAITAQLDVFGYSKDDRADIGEKLNQLHQIYMSSYSG
jgi:hypothetical protein